MDKETVLEPEPVLEDACDYYTKEKYQLQDERYDYVFKCKACGNKIFMDNYCSKCGQKLR